MTTQLSHSNKMKWKGPVQHSETDDINQLKRDNIQSGALLVNMASTLFLHTCARYDDALSEEANELLERKIRAKVESLRNDLSEFNEAILKSEDE